MGKWNCTTCFHLVMGDVCWGRPAILDVALTWSKHNKPQCQHMKQYKRVFHLLPTCTPLSVVCVSGEKQQLRHFPLGWEGAGAEMLLPPHPLPLTASNISRYVSFCERVVNHRDFLRRKLCIQGVKLHAFLAASDTSQLQQ